MDRKFTFIVLGVVIWLAGVIMIRLLHPYVYGDPVLHALFFALNFAIVPLGLIPIAKFTGRTKHDMLAPVAIMAMPSMLMDSLSVTFDSAGVSHIYADTPLAAAYSGGILLFAFWGFFFFALLWHRPTSKV